MKKPNPSKSPAKLQLETSRAPIDEIDTTSDTLTARAGLSLFVKWLDQIEFITTLMNFMPPTLRKRKGLSIGEILRQIIIFLVDGTSRHLSHFDHTARDPGYAAAIGTKPEHAASSHTIKRLIGYLSFLLPDTILRAILRYIYCWHLRVKKAHHAACGWPAPTTEIYLDSSVLNNNDAKQREGCTPTYKDVIGYHPITLQSDGIIIDCLFRDGHRHCNAGMRLRAMLHRTITLIRAELGPQAPIILRMDAGFLDIKLLRYIDEDLRIIFIISGKMYNSIKELFNEFDPEDLRTIELANGHQWDYLESQWSCASWGDKHYRTLHLRPHQEEEQEQESPQPAQAPNRAKAVNTPKSAATTAATVTTATVTTATVPTATVPTATASQLLFTFARPEKIILTNASPGYAGHDALPPETAREISDPAWLIESHHRQGQDELSYRTLKDFASQTLPFSHRRPNSLWFHLMLIALSLFRGWQNQILALEHPELGKAYPSTIRRRVIDTAGKIIKTARKTVIKVMQSTLEHLKLDKLWEHSRQARPLSDWLPHIIPSPYPKLQPTR